MAQRDRHHLNVVGRCSHESVDIRRGARDVAVAQQHALSTLSRTGCEQQVCRIFDATTRFEGGVRRGPLLGRRERSRGRRCRIAGVFSQYERRRAVLEQLPNVFSRHVGADRYCNTAGSVNGEVGDGECDRVLAEECDPVSGSKAEIEQPPGSTSYGSRASREGKLARGIAESSAPPAGRRQAAERADKRLCFRAHGSPRGAIPPLQNRTDFPDAVHQHDVLEREFDRELLLQCCYELHLPERIPRRDRGRRRGVVNLVDRDSEGPGDDSSEPLAHAHGRVALGAREAFATSSPDPASSPSSNEGTSLLCVLDPMESTGRIYFTIGLPGSGYTDGGA